MIKKTVEEKKKRSVLSEGRNQGMGFAMLKRIDSKNYHTVNPISPCKDFLAEVIFTENTGMGTAAYGLNYTEKNNILGKRKSYLVYKNMKPSKGDEESFSVEKKTFEQYSKEIKDGRKNIQDFINQFQTELGGGYAPCRIEEVNDDQFLVSFDTRWAKSPYNISLFTLMLRVAKHYKDKQKVLEYLDSVPNTNIDYSLLKTARKKIVTILKNKKLIDIPKSHIKSREQDKNWTPHDAGICSWDEKYD